MTWRPFVPPSVSFQSKLALHLSFHPSICVSSYVTSTHLSHTTTTRPSAAVACCHHLRPSLCPHVRPQWVSVRSLYVLSVCENVGIDIRSITCPLRPSRAPRSSEGCDFLLLRSRFSSVFHAGVKRGVCSQINHFPEDADFDHDGAEYVLRKSRATLSQFSGGRDYFFFDSLKHQETEKASL